MQLQRLLRPEHGPAPGFLGAARFGLPCSSRASDSSCNAPARRSSRIPARRCRRWPVAGANAIAARTNGVEMTARVVATHDRTAPRRPRFHPDAARRHGGITPRHRRRCRRLRAGRDPRHQRELRAVPACRRETPPCTATSPTTPSPYRETAWYRHAAACPHGCWGERLPLAIARPAADQLRRARPRQRGPCRRRRERRRAADVAAGVGRRTRPGPGLAGLRPGRTRASFSPMRRRERIGTSIFALAETTRTPELAQHGAAHDRRRNRLGHDTTARHCTNRHRRFSRRSRVRSWSLAIVVPMSSIFRDTRDIFLAYRGRRLGRLWRCSACSSGSPYAACSRRLDNSSRRPSTSRAASSTFPSIRPRRLDEVGRLTRSFIAHARRIETAHRRPDRRDRGPRAAAERARHRAPHPGIDAAARPPRTGRSRRVPAARPLARCQDGRRRSICVLHPAQRLRVFPDRRRIGQGCARRTVHGAHDHGRAERRGPRGATRCAAARTQRRTLPRQRQLHVRDGALRRARTRQRQTRARERRT